MRLMRRKHKNKSGPAQRDSGMSNLKTCPYRPYCPYRPLVFKTAPAQRDSGISNLKVETENSLPQRHSNVSNLDFPLCLCASVVKRLFNGTPECLNWKVLLEDNFRL